MPDRHRSSAPEDYSGKFIIPPQGPAPVTDVFPAGVWLHLLETGIRAIQLSPYHADLPARHPVRLGTAAGFLGRGRLPGEVPFLALFPGSPLPNPPCEFPRHGLSGDYAVSNAAMCSA